MVLYNLSTSCSAQKTPYSSGNRGGGRGGGVYWPILQLVLGLSSWVNADNRMKRDGLMPREKKKWENKEKKAQNLASTEIIKGKLTWILTSNGLKCTNLS